jgi:hypothetical protein
MIEIIRDVHGVPLWLLQEYLIELGGELKGDQHVVGHGWNADFYKIENYKIGSIVIGRVRLELRGEDLILEKLVPKLEIKLMRGGG